MTTLYHPKFLNSLRLKKSNSIREKDFFQKSSINTPSSIFRHKEYESQKNSDILSRNNINNMKLASLSLNEKKSKYANFTIFKKREYAFHKSIENNKKVFKYQNYSLFEEKKRPTLKKIKTNFNRNNSNLFQLSKTNFSSLYLTESVLGMSKTIIQSKNSSKNSSILNDIPKKNTNLIKMIKNNHFFKNELNVYNERERLNKSKEDIFGNNNIIKKNKYMDIGNAKEMTKSKYIQKLREYVLGKYNLEMKKEKSKIIEDNLKDNIGFINDKIKNLENDYHNFNNNFLNKFTEYSKQIMQIRDDEKNRYNIYLNYIMKLKKDVIDLKQKNKKLRNYRNSLSRWMYLQIRVKEKLKVLPSYYKIILENNMKENAEELSKIDKDKIDNILKYKNHIIYKDADLFLSQIKKYENQNLELLINYNSIRDEINILNKIKNYFEEEEAHFSEIEKANEELYENKYKYLLFLKNKYNKLLHYKQSLKYYIHDNDNDSMNKKHSILYYKIYNLLEHLNSYMNYDFHEAGLVMPYKDIPEESQNVLNLAKLELITDIFIRNHNYYKKEYSEKMNELQAIFDKSKKLQKNLEQIKTIKIKFEKERNKIFKKNKKVIILPTHKLYINNILAKRLIMKKLKEQKKKKKETIEDYLYDLYDNEK